MDVRSYSELALSHAAVSNLGAFYGAITTQTVGVGLIYDGVEFPAFDTAASSYKLVTGMAYVLTHECDVDQANARSFNDLVVICPVQTMQDFIAPFQEAGKDDALRNLVPAAAANTVSRLFYLPPPPELLRAEGLEHGGFLYLNHLASIPLTAFDSARPVCALSEFGLRHVDAKLENHFFRPKDDRLPRVI